jgi:carbamoyl-phosphate synthase small subunit
MTMPLKPAPNAALMLADGTVFFGYGIGEAGTTSGEICFNTAMTGYQEILTDPSYAGQIITFTFPHIGNVGTNDEDIESLMPAACGLILREAITEPSSFRATSHLHAWMKRHNLRGISGIDTRALTRHIRLKGAQNCAIIVSNQGAPNLDKLKAALEAAPDMNGLELAAHHTTSANYAWTEQRWELGSGYPQLAQAMDESVRSRDGRGEPLASAQRGGAVAGAERPHVIAIDYGVKRNILRSLASAGVRLTVVPATTTAEEILALNPDGVFLSNGPGDPAATGSYAVPTIKKLLEASLRGAAGDAAIQTKETSVAQTRDAGLLRSARNDRPLPIFGICLGHQMLGIALGCRTEKMRQGHRGANHPVKDLQTGKVEITSQNHGFAISDTALPPEVEVTHRSLFDGTIQGIAVKGKPIFSVQGHPEASPGPHDSQYLFARFVEMMRPQPKKAA